MTKIFKIFKGYHYPFPLDFGGLKSIVGIFRPKDCYSFSGVYKFDKSCEYSLDGGDQSDVNKLVGISFGFHHKNSVRVGWRYKDGVIEICYYAYQNSKRLPTIVIGTVDLDSLFTLDINIGRRSKNVEILLRAQNREPVIKTFVYELPSNKTYLSYGLGIYFGGNRTAPHTMTIERQVDIAKIIHIEAD